MDRAREAVERVMDPEVPVLSVVDLGIIRAVDVDDTGHVTVAVTPTYSGCPAMRVIEHEILESLRESGFDDAEVKTVYSPAWTTDWITSEGRARLKEYGIAPPGPREESTELVPLLRRLPAIECPFCGSHNTQRRSEFGSTACKATWFCNGCRQPFEEFKPI